MAAAGDVIEIIGRGTSISASVDAIASFGGNNPSKLSTSVHLAKRSRG